MKKTSKFLLLFLVVGLLGITTINGQEGISDFFEKKQQEKLANDKLSKALNEETDKVEISFAKKSSCAGEDESKSEFSAKVSPNEILAIYAKGIPSSGYKWLLEPGYESTLELVVENLGPSEIAGIEAEKRFVLKGIAKGTTMLKFVYKRPWEDKAPLKVCIVNVTSKGKYKGNFDFTEDLSKPLPKIEETTNKALPSSFDWRSQGKVTSVKNQGSSAACWAFGTCASTESAILIAGGASRDLSEQYLCNCSNGSCADGGWFAHWLFLDEGRGAVYESEVPFYGSDQTCGTYNYHEQLDSWGWTDGVSDTGWPSKSHNASNTQIKNAIYNYGPVAANCYSDCWANSTGIQNVNCSGGAHIVTIVGWNDAGQYWIVKNSWGSGWGDNGYLYLRYNTCEMGVYSTWCKAKGGTATDTQAPSTPSGLSSTGATSSSVSLSWNASTDNVGVTGYDVYRNSTIVATASGTSYTVTGLSANTNYSFNVRAKDAAGNVSGYSNTISVTTENTGPDDGGPLTNNVTANGSISSSGDTDMWYIDVAANATSMRVVLECGSSDFDTHGKFNAEPTTSSYDWRGYTSGGEDNTVNNPQQGRHYIMVNPYSGTGNYTLKATITYGSSDDTQAPSTPTGLNSTGTTSSSVSLSWNASTDNVGVTSYTINNSTDNQNYTTSGTSYTVSGLTANKSYTFYVNAKDAAGNTSGWSNAVTVTTDDGGGVTLPDYCAAKANNGGEHISNVQFGSINNSSSREDYQNFTNISTNVNAGSTYTLNVTIGSPYNNANEAVAFFDWNRDGDFEDSGEKFVLSVSNGSDASASISVPIGAANGPTGMRIRVSYYDNQEPCGDNQYGEVEDYAVNIQGGSSVPMSMTLDESEMDVTVFPNPSSGNFTLSVKSEAKGTVSVDIYNTAGQLVFTQRSDKDFNGPVEIPMNVSLSTGLYSLKISLNNKSESIQLMFE